MNEHFIDYSTYVVFNNDLSRICFQGKYCMSDNLYRYPKINEIVPGVGIVTAICCKNLIYIK